MAKIPPLMQPLVDPKTGMITPGAWPVFFQPDPAGTVPAGTGDVVGPDGAVDGNLAVFDGIDGKKLKDGGPPGEGGGGGDTEAAYVLLGLDPDLPNAKVLVGTSKRVIVTEGPASVALSTPQDLDTDSTPQFAGQGLGTAAEAGSVVKAAGHTYVVQHDAGSSGAAATIDWQHGNSQLLLLTDNVVLTFVNGKPGGRYFLRLKQGPGAPFAPVWPGSVVWSGDVSPTFSQVEDGLDVVGFYNDGTNYIGAGANAAALTQGLPEIPLAVRHGGTGHFVVAEGDLFVGAADGTLSKLPVSSLPGCVLTNDASVPGKVKWAPASDAARVACSVYIASDFVLNDAVFYKVEFDTEDWDAAGMHDNGNPTRITIPVAGFYLVMPSVSWIVSGDGYMACRVLINGTLRAESGGIGNGYRPPTYVFSLAAGDYIEIELWQHNGYPALVYGGAYRTSCQVTQVK